MFIYVRNKRLLNFKRKFIEKLWFKKMRLEREIYNIWYFIWSIVDFENVLM